MDTKTIKLILLNLPGWGTVSVRKLLSVYAINELSEPEFILDAIETVAYKHKRIKIPIISEIQEAFDQAETIKTICSDTDIQIIDEMDNTYPTRLNNQENRPLILYAKGNVNIINDTKIYALIGTREPNDWIYKSMHRVSYRCTENNIHVLSGLALGCDTAAHKGCLDGGGKSIAVLGNGLDIIYPKQNQGLAEDILTRDGCLISEYEPGKPTNKFQLIARDKLQANLSDAIIVGQTSKNGGAMHAANHALQKLSRPVAVLTGERCEGNLFSGNHELLEQGATALGNVQDVKKFIGVPEKKWQAVLFDLDQTLVDSSQLEPMRKARDWSSVLAHLHLVEPIEGVNEYLATLKKNGLKTGLVTSSPKHYAKALCQRFGWNFDVIVAYHDTKNHKPHPEPLIKAAEQLCINSEQCIYIGDDEKDSKAAASAHMMFIPLLATEQTPKLEVYLNHIG